jgi:CBS-domain-containing membrane protein
MPGKAIMRVQDLMSTSTISCSAIDTLDDAARLMWKHDCGALPVVGADGRLAGMITDHDVCMAAYSRGGTLRDLLVVDSMATAVVSCTPSMGIIQARKALSDACVRRAPVVDDEHVLIGMVTLGDLARCAAHPQAREQGLGSASEAERRSAIGTLRTRHAAAAQPATS